MSVDAVTVPATEPSSMALCGTPTAAISGRVKVAEASAEPR